MMLVQVYSETPKYDASSRPAAISEDERAGTRHEDDGVRRPRPPDDHAVRALRGSPASTTRASRTTASTTSAAPGRLRTSPTPCPASIGK